jgi:hypothetical protein
MSYPTFVKRSRVKLSDGVRADLVAMFGQAAGGVIGGTPVYLANLKSYKDAYAALDTKGDTHVVVGSMYEGNTSYLIHELCHVYHWYSCREATIRAACHHPDRMEVAVFFCMWRLCALVRHPEIRRYMEDMTFPGDKQRSNVLFGRAAQVMYPYQYTSWVTQKILTGNLELR